MRNILVQSQEAGLHMERKYISIMFTDIVGFTQISENLHPDLLVTALSLFFEEMTRIIEQNQGIVDKFIGDAYVVENCQKILQFQSE